MLERIAVGLLAGTVVSASAWAQTTAPAQPAAQNQATTTNQTPGLLQGRDARYVTENRRDLWRASRLEGLSVYNNNNEKVGEISEVLVNRQGQVEAVVIGVGGFLGIGERHVAVPFDAIHWQQESNARTAATTTTTTTGTVENANQPAAPTAATSGAAGTNAPATTGATTTRMASAGDQTRDYPERAILPNATREQLEGAPEFRFTR